MLADIRIIEFEALGPAPFASMMLADLGAEVIVIHRETGVDSPGQPEKNPLDRGKKSIVLNLKEENDIKIANALIASSDAIIEGMRPGVMERLGFGPKKLLSRNEKLVYGRMTGWGQEGPLALEAGHDLNYIGRSGALWYASNAGECPFTPPTLVGDIGGGALYLVAGLLSALLRVKNGGLGCVVDAAIVDGASHMMSLLLSLRSSGGLKEKRGESLLDGPHWSRSYVCKCGGYISVQCLEPKFYSIFLECLKLEKDLELAEQFNKELWSSNIKKLTDIFANQTQQEWVEVFSGKDACVAPILSPESSQKDPHILFRDIWREENGHLQARPAPRFSDWSSEFPSKIPVKDSSREELLYELNMKD